MNGFQMNDSVVDFLLTGDPSIAFQTRKYLLDEDEEKLKDLQKETLLTGFGKRFFDAQHEDGSFGQSHYVGKWTSIHYTLLDLRYLEIPEDTEKARVPARNILLKHPALDGSIAISSDKKSDLCVDGMYLTYAAYFGVEEQLLRPLIDLLLVSILPDGGFNCRSNRETVHHSSMHTTICVLEGLLEYRCRGYVYRIKEVEMAMDKASEFLLMHHLFRSDRTGDASSIRSFSFLPSPPDGNMRSIGHSIILPVHLFPLMKGCEKRFCCSKKKRGRTAPSREVLPMQVLSIFLWKKEDGADSTPFAACAS